MFIILWAWFFYLFNTYKINRRERYETLKYISLQYLILRYFAGLAVKIHPSNVSCMKYSKSML